MEAVGGRCATSGYAERRNSWGAAAGLVGGPDHWNVAELQLRYGER